tara:strand:- start:1212 stop:1463 length:252 start_codon:yes stop_codon:yes gene_type:complete
MEGELKKVANTHFFNHCFYKNLITNQWVFKQFDFKCANKLGKQRGFREIKRISLEPPFFCACNKMAISLAYFTALSCWAITFG